MDQPTEPSFGNEQPLPDILKSLDAIESDAHIAHAQETLKIQLEMEELDRQLDVARQSVLDELLTTMPTDVIKLRALAASMDNGDGYDDLYIHLDRLGSVYLQATGTRSPELDHLYDFLRVVDDVATAIVMYDKRVVLEGSCMSSSLSPDERSTIINITNKLVDNTSIDALDPDAQLAAMNENESKEETMQQFKLYRDHVLPLLDAEFSRYCSLDDPVYRELRTSVLTPLFFGWSVSVGLTKDLSSLGITRDVFEELIEKVKKQI